MRCNEIYVIYVMRWWVYDEWWMVDGRMVDRKMNRCVDEYMYYMVKRWINGR